MGVTFNCFSSIISSCSGKTVAMTLDGKLFSERSHLMLSSWLNSQWWQWDPHSQLIRFMASMPSDACLHQDSRTDGTSLELSTIFLLNSVIHQQSKDGSINTIHMSALAPTMPTTFQLYLEEATLLPKQFWAIALRLHQMPFHHLEIIEFSTILYF